LLIVFDVFIYLGTQAISLYFLVSSPLLCKACKCLTRLGISIKLVVDAHSARCKYGGHHVKQNPFESKSKKLLKVMDRCRVMYDRAVDLWQLVFAVLKALDHNELAKSIPGKISGLFWSAHQRFFRQMLIACKVRLSCSWMVVGM
jgi:hypothetical protein